MARLSALAYETDYHALAAKLDRVGFPDFKRFEDGKTGAAAFVCWNLTDAVFAARGTERSAADILTDVKFRREDLISPGGDGLTVERVGAVHRGFLAAWRAIASPAMDSMHAQFDARRNLWFTGHSLGGALAVLAATASPAFMDYGVNLVTFGCPRVGDKTFADHHGRRVDHWRFVRGADIVPLLPLLFLGFRHGWHSVHIDCDGKIHEGATLWREAWGRLRSLVTFDWARVPVGIGLGPVGVAPAAMIGDHAIGGYLESLTGETR